MSPKKMVQQDDLFGGTVTDWLIDSGIDWSVG